MQRVTDWYRKYSIVGKGFWKVLFGIVLLSALAYHLLKVQSWEAWQLSYAQLSSDFLFWPFLMAVALSIPNWFIETLKWRTGVAPRIRIGVRDAGFIILRGVTGASITPARLGEYAGRMYGLNTADDRWASITSTFVGSLAQNLVTLYFGLISFSYLFLNAASGSYYPDYALVILSLVTMLSLFTLFLKAEPLMRFLVKSFKQDRWRKWSESIHDLKWRAKNIILGWSFFRYVVYVTQYLLLAYAFQIDVFSIDAIAIIAAILSIQSLIPLPASIAMVARAEIALWLWGLLQVGELHILFTTYSLWAINLMIPALIGYISVWTSGRSRASRT